MEAVRVCVSYVYSFIRGHHTLNLPAPPPLCKKGSQWSEVESQYSAIVL